MKLAIASDLHLDVWGVHQIEHHKKRFENHYNADVLILAGDTAEFIDYSHYIDFFRYLSQQYSTIIMIAGNHEFYRGNIETDYSSIQKWIKDNHLRNFKFLDNSTLKIDNVRFFGSTLWTSIDNINPMIMSKVHYVMNDYRRIKYNDRILKPEDTIKFHQSAIDYLGNSIKRYKNEDTTKVVITHHAPSLMSIHSKYNEDKEMFDISFAYCSDLIDVKGKFPDELVDFWIHGHVHDEFDYIAANGKTRVIANPLGYTNERASHFGPMFDEEFGWFLKIIDIK